MTEHKAELVIDADAMLAEGSIWHPTEQKLYWIDIEHGELHRYDPEKDYDEMLKLPQRIGTVVPIRSGGMLGGLEDQIAKIDMDSGSIEKLVDLEKDRPGTRCNDGKCDPAGRFWVGTMGLNAEEHAGALYRIDGDGQVDKILDQLTIPNGLIWLHDHKTFYHIDSPEGNVKAYDYDIDSGSISNPRTVINIPDEWGLPDGMTIDEEGMLWIAVFGGSMVGRWNPEDGQLIQKVTLPVPDITSCAFGGPELDILYITTAQHELDEEEKKKFPQSGGIFKAKPGINGVKAAFFNT